MYHDVRHYTVLEAQQWVLETQPLWAVVESYICILFRLELDSTNAGHIVTYF